MVQFLQQRVTPLNCLIRLGQIQLEVVVLPPGLLVDRYLRHTGLVLEIVLLKHVAGTPHPIGSWEHREPIGPVASVLLDFIKGLHHVVVVVSVAVALLLAVVSDEILVLWELLSWEVFLGCLLALRLLHL